MEKHHNVPAIVRRPAYSAVTHYLKAVAAVGKKGAEGVMRTMRATPINDHNERTDSCQEQQSGVRHASLLVETPAESEYEFGLQTDRYRPGSKGIPPNHGKPVPARQIEMTLG